MAEGFSEAETAPEPLGTTPGSARLRPFAGAAAGGSAGGGAVNEGSAVGLAGMVLLGVTDGADGGVDVVTTLSFAAALVVGAESDGRSTTTPMPASSNATAAAAST